MTVVRKVYKVDATKLAPLITTAKYIVPGLCLAAVFTKIIDITAVDLARRFEIVGVKRFPLFYPWKLRAPSIASRLSAWLPYIAHNLIAWGIIYYANRDKKTKYSDNLRWFNWGLIVVHLGFILLHILQTQLWYDGLAQDVHEATSLASVMVLLSIVLVLETPQRGLFLGHKVKFHQLFFKIVREYHSYYFSWATIYTFWYHPTEGTIGHLMGFFYMFMLFVQSALIFNRAHTNKIWTLTIELFVLIHSAAVAFFHRQPIWPMFIFGLSMKFMLIQMYGLGLSNLATRCLWAAFITLVLGFYAYMERLPMISEIIRIPTTDYLIIGLLYAIFWMFRGAHMMFFGHNQKAMSSAMTACLKSYGKR